MTSAQKPVQPRSQDLSLGSVWAFIVCPLFARFICPYVMRCLTFSCHCLIVFIKYFAVYKCLYIKSTMTLEQKGEKKQMLAYDLDFALPMRHEYHRRDTWTVVGGRGFSMYHKVGASISSFDEQSMVLLLKLCETEEGRILFLLLPYYHWYPFQKLKRGQKMSEKIIIPCI